MVTGGCEPPPLSFSCSVGNHRLHRGPWREDVQGDYKPWVRTVTCLECGTWWFGYGDGATKPLESASEDIDWPAMFLKEKR